MNLGLLFAQRGSHLEAVERLERVLGDDAAPPPQLRPDLYTTLGQSYAALGAPDRAVRVFEECLRRVRSDVPHDAAVQIRYATFLSYALTDAREYERAAEVVREALAGADEQPDPYTRVRLYWSLARLSAVEGRQAESLEYIRSASAPGRRSRCWATSTAGSRARRYTRSRARSRCPGTTSARTTRTGVRWICSPCTAARPMPAKRRSSGRISSAGGTATRRPSPSFGAHTISAWTPRPPQTASVDPRAGRSPRRPVLARPVVEACERRDALPARRHADDDAARRRRRRGRLRAAARRRRRRAASRERGGARAAAVRRPHRRRSQRVPAPFRP